MKRVCLILASAAVASIASLRANDAPSGDSTVSDWNTYRERFEVTQRALTSLGAGSCAGANCHAGAAPRLGEVFLGDEWNRWYAEGRGPHFRAYKVLYEDPRSDRMARLLFGAGAVAKERAECLDCHALHVDETYRGRSYDLEDGITCEACHGKSELWQGPHQNPKVWREKNTAEQRTAMGYYDTRDLIRRTEKCLECHLGTASKRVTHEMMAAGHPPLTFELVEDSEGVPKHWKDEQCFLAPDEGSYFHARAWAVGQLVTFRESMYRLTDWISRGDHADYALFDCYACHHDINNADWRQQRAVQGSLGEPPFDLSAWALCRPIIGLFAPGDADTFQKLVDALAHNCVPRGGNPAVAREAAARLVAMTDALAQTAATRRFDGQAIHKLLTQIIAERRSIADLGFTAATQAFYALKALHCRATPDAKCREGALDDAGRAIAALHDHLFDKSGADQPANYDPQFVRDQLQALGRHLNIDKTPTRDEDH